MSADSPRRSGTGSRVARQSGVPIGGNGLGQVVVPVPVTDPSIIDSVTGFINDVVPQAYTTLPPGDGKEAITWARFESADVNDPTFYPDISSDTTLPLLLVLGYSTGVQVWSIPANGEATEVLSWSQGSVRTLRILPSPASNTLRSSDAYAPKRPLVALCDSAGPGPGPPFCSVSFISLKTGDQVKSIKFKNQVCDVLANRRSVVVTFLERIAVFDACTLEDRLSITSCYPSPGPNCNPVTIGSRWLAFSEKKLVAWQRSSGGVGGSGTQSYTATVLHAAQTLGRGLRGLSETVASSLTGPRNHSGGGTGSLGSSPPSMNGTDHNTPGVVTVLDLEASCSRHNGSEELIGNSSLTSSSSEGVVAHFVAHSEAIVALQFDPSGMLLVTADRRGHNFHVFRIQPHPGGSSLAAVHHLYILHRGDTTAKVQDVSFSCDSRWVAVSTMRGTTHVFPLTPYGGPVGFRTHGSPHVVNRLSRFHRSAGLSADGRSSPVPSPESPPCLPAGPHANPRLPPYPHATVQAPLSQLRQSPHPPLTPAGALDVSLRVCAAFAAPRTWLLESHTPNPREGPGLGSRDTSKALRRAVDSLFVMAGHGNLVQYDLEPIPVLNGHREKVCDDTPIELDVEARAQWPLQRSPHTPEVLPPLPSNNPLLSNPVLRVPTSESDNCQQEEHWLSQVEIITHAGPHRRLWMGPQITFKTYTTNIGCSASLHDVEAVEVGTVPISRPARSNPVNMPSGGRPLVPVLIESGSGSSLEQSPHLLEVYGADTGDVDSWSGQGDSRLREDLADAMLESPGAPSREKGKRRYYGLVGGGGGEGEREQGEGRVVRGISGSGCGPVRRVVNPGGAEITMWSDGEASDIEQHDLAEHPWEAIAIPASAPVLPLPLPQAPPYHSHQHPDGAVAREMVTTIPAQCVRARTAPLSTSSGSGNFMSRRGDSSGEGPLSPRSSWGDGEGEGNTDVNALVTEMSRQKSRRVAETTVPPHVCKKSKKNNGNSVVPDKEAPVPVRRVKAGKTQKMSEDREVAPEPQAEVENDVEIEHVIVPPGKKGKRHSVAQDRDDVGLSDAVTNSNSPKEILDIKGGKRPAFSSEKEQNEDPTSLLSKKNKKKVSLIAREIKKDGNEFNHINNDTLASQAGGESQVSNVGSTKIVNSSISEECVKPLGSLNEINVENGSKFEPVGNGGISEHLKSALRGNKKKERGIVYDKMQNKEENFVDVLSTTINSSVNQQEVVHTEETLADTPESQVNGNLNGAVGCINNAQERASFPLDTPITGEIERDLKEAVDDISSDPKPHCRKRAISASKDHKSVSSEIDNCMINLSTNVNPPHLLKQSSLDSVEIPLHTNKAAGQKIEEYVTTLEQNPPALINAWRVLQDADSSEDLKNFPALSSKCNKKGWGVINKEEAVASQKDDAKGLEKVPEVVARKPKSRGVLICESTNSPERNRKDDQDDCDLAVKSKNLCEPAAGENADCDNLKTELVNKSKPDLDLENLTFEDLEAIVDAVCKEEDVGTDKMRLKENDKKKKIESYNVSSTTKKGRGKENVEDDTFHRTNDAAQKSDAAKSVTEVIKQEEAPKPVEKPVTTPNKTSKSQRRKRR